MTPEILWAFGRIGTVEVSPDGNRLLYPVTYYSVKENKSNTELFVMNTDGSEKKQITETTASEGAAKWMKDGKQIAFLSSESGSRQLWIMKADGSDRRQITDREGGISDFLFSPDETRIVFIADVKARKTVADLHPDLPLAEAYIAEDLMYKHWDEWVTSAPHPFVADFDGKKLSNEKDVMEGEFYESPVKPMGGIEQLAWSADGKVLAYCSRKKMGKEYAESTNTDIYFYEIETGNTVNKTKGMMGYDLNPVFSPDGKWMGKVCCGMDTKPINTGCLF